MSEQTKVHFKWIESPVGELLIVSDGHSLTGLYLKGQKHFPASREDWVDSPKLGLFAQVEQQLAEYFDHQRQQFDIPAKPKGTAFQKQVWQQLNDIPFGETISYGALARQIGQPGASRAVGAANGRNPISIIVPCHRVIAASGKLTGYAGGVERKQWLLAHEQKVGSPVMHQTSLFS